MSLPPREDYLKDIKKITYENQVSTPEFLFGMQTNNPSSLPIGWNPDAKDTVNPHLLLCGLSGSGKTTILKQLIRYLERHHKHIYVLDTQGDIKIKDDNGNLIGNYIQFTAWGSEFGIQPFEFDTGVTKEELNEYVTKAKEPTEAVMKILKSAGPKVQAIDLIEIIQKNFLYTMGPEQKNAFYDIFMDSYKMKGFEFEDYTTWLQDELPNLGDTLELIDRAKVLFEATENKLDTRAVKLIGKINAKIEEVKNQGLKLDLAEGQEPSSLEEFAEIIADVNKYIKERLENGQKGLDTIWFEEKGIRYEKYLSKEKIRTLTKLASYLRSLHESGVFHAKAPPVKPGLNIIDISGLNHTIQRFMADIFLGKIFKACKVRGEYKERPPAKRQRGEKCDTFIVLDETNVITGSKDKNNPWSYTNRIAKESRKYGLGMCVAAQASVHFPEEFLRNFSAQIIMGTNRSDYDNVRKHFGVKAEMLEHTQKIGGALVKVNKQFVKVDMPRFDTI
jgi:energy-coupling factor transporter ATP-binding protein EcfA2